MRRIHHRRDLGTCSARWSSGAARRWGPEPDLPDRMFFEAVLYRGPHRYPVARTCPGEFGAWGRPSTNRLAAVDPLGPAGEAVSG